ncbi:MAG TPA: hypothetical protein VHG93_21720 [Longimicrobium sp.]|nr:hypothetical protein [Longimicrobium sp.]
MASSTASSSAAWLVLPSDDQVPASENSPPMVTTCVPPDPVPSPSHAAAETSASAIAAAVHVRRVRNGRARGIEQVAQP